MHTGESECLTYRNFSVPVLSMLMTPTTINEQIFIPHYLGEVITAAGLQDSQKLNASAIFVAILAIIGGVVGFFRSWLFTLSGHRIVARLRYALWLSNVQHCIRVLA